MLMLIHTLSSVTSGSLLKDEEHGLTPNGTPNNSSFLYVAEGTEGQARQR